MRNYHIQNLDSFDIAVVSGGDAGKAIDYLNGEKDPDFAKLNLDYPSLYQPSLPKLEDKSPPVGVSNVVRRRVKQ